MNADGHAVGERHRVAEIDQSNANRHALAGGHPPQKGFRCRKMRPGIESYSLERCSPREHLWKAVELHVQFTGNACTESRTAFRYGVVEHSLDECGVDWPLDL